MTNKSHRPTNEDAIEAIAADWLVERDEGFAAARAEAFTLWCEFDPRHRVAVARLEATHRLLQQLPRLRDDDGLVRRVEQMIKPEPVARVIPFPYFRIAAAAAVLALAAVLWWWPSRGDFQQEFATTETGANVTLPDKSRVELGSNSDVRVKYSARTRQVDLTRGEANFSVARDAARPFVVAAGEINVLAVGTVFKVRFGPDAVEVLVSEGKVQVSRDGFAGVDALVAGEKLEFRSHAAGLAGNGQAVDSSLQPPAAITPSNRLVFNGTPLWKVIEEFNRRNQVQLVLGDDEILDRPVGGEFEGDKVKAFVRSLKNTGEISAEWAYPSTIVLRKGN